VVLANKNEISGNTIRGALRSGELNTNGHSVTWVSGQDFSGLRTGHSITINRTRYFISEVASSVNILLTRSAGVQGKVAYSAGSLEGINIDAAQENIVANNLIRDMDDGGIIVHASTQGQDTFSNFIQNNYISNVAAMGIGLEASGGIVAGNQVRGNSITDVVVAPAATTLQSDVGIRVAAANAIDNTVEGNTVIDTRGIAATIQYAVALDAVGPRNVAVNNLGAGVINEGTR
jgi:hypothetical protein